MSTCPLSVGSGYKFQWHRQSSHSWDCKFCVSVSQLNCSLQDLRGEMFKFSFLLNQINCVQAAVADAG